MGLGKKVRQNVAAYTLYAWDHPYAFMRLVAPWQHTGVELLRGTQWDQVHTEQVAVSELVVIHRDFPRLAEDYQQVMQQARSLNKPVFFDLDDLLFELPPQHPDRQFHYLTDALFPILQAVFEADAVTVSTPALREAILPFNPNILLLPTCLDDRLWPVKEIEVTDNPQPLIIGWVNDGELAGGTEVFASGIEQFLRKQGSAVLLRVWGGRPPETLLALSNVDWLPDISTNYSHYAANISNEHIDLAIVPHGDSAYYSCHSPLRYLEYSACGVVGIYSRVPPYSDIISHEQNGWLASTAGDWLHALETLAGSTDLRQQVATSAQKTVRQGWLLSQNAHRWKEALEHSTQLAAEHKRYQPVADHVANLADQVRLWQRSLESRLRDREWELRATNLMMVRKDRQASEYIEQLGSQLEEIWSDPAWRVLHKAQRLVKLATQPGSANKPGRQPVEAAGTETAPEGANHTSGESQVFSDLRENVVAAKMFDLFCFAGTTWEQLPGKLRTQATRFAGDGMRVFIISQAETLAESPTFNQVGDRIFKLTLPADNLGNESRDLSPEGKLDRYQAWFDSLRLELGISAAICWVEHPSWAWLAYRLRNSYGWKIVSNHQVEREAPSHTSPQLQLRGDLLFQTPIDDMPYPQVWQALQNLFPLTSIIILTYNNLDYTRQCLESISAKTVYPNYEIVIVDNASSDGTVDYLQTYATSHPNVQLVLNKENRGFSAGNNQGVTASKGQYIVYLNNDTVVTSSWLSGLISHLRDPAVGAVGPVTNSAGNESKIGVDYSDISELHNFARRYTRAHDGEAFDIRMLALYCMLVRRSVIDDVGLLDERFGVGMYEDDDFSLRIRQKGYRILCAEDVYVHHWGSASFSQLAAERYQRLQRENRQIFEEKWGTRWQPHRWRMEEA
jgi:GT2 family glycosyltransferase